MGMRGIPLVERLDCEVCNPVIPVALPVDGSIVGVSGAGANNSQGLTSGSRTSAYQKYGVAEPQESLVEQNICLEATASGEATGLLALVSVFLHYKSPALSQRFIKVLLYIAAH